MMSNDDSFSNIAPVQEDKSPSALAEANKTAAEGANIDDLNLDQSLDKELTKKKAPASSTNASQDVDVAIQEIMDKEGLKPGEAIYDAKALHPKNLEYLDEYVDEDDPGFDTYVVNEENFVASCQELARLNSFPDRAI